MLKNMFRWAAVIVLMISVAGFVECKQPDIVCVPITRCPVLLKLIMKRPLSAENFNVIRQSHCGFEKTVQKVWCLILDGEENEEHDIIDLRSGEEESRDNRDVKSVKNILPSNKVCGQYSQDRIIGGEQTEIDEFPWTALLYYRGNKGESLPGCGGALITNRHVLTAAHCITRRQPESVVLGEYHVRNETDCLQTFDDELECSPPPVRVNIADISVHPEWSRNDRPFYNDIALIRLDREVEFSDFVAPICLPRGHNSLETIKADTMLTVTGWGLTENRKRSDIKLKVDVPLVPRSRCTVILGRTIKSGQICAGGHVNKDSCKGDSGGPLMHLNDEQQAWTLTGLVSLGTKTCGLHNVPGIYTYVPHYLDWIIQNIQ